MIPKFDNDYDRAMGLLRVLEAYATGEKDDNNEMLFKELRGYFYTNLRYKTYLPKWLNSIFTLKQFWGVIQPKFKTYAGRRAFLSKELAPLINFCSEENTILNEQSDVINSFDSEFVSSMWDKMLQRINDDPEGAITLARSTLESICKHMLDKKEITYSKSESLTSLYSMVAKELNLSPKQHENTIIKDILNGCNKIVQGLSDLRREYGDAHGKGLGKIKPSPRHARLAVNATATMCLFLVETHDKHKQ